MTAIAEPMLVPNADRLRELREQRGWTIDDAVYHARRRSIPLSRQTIVDLESGDGGCRLATIGRAMKLYEVTDLDELTREVPEPSRRKVARKPT